MWRDGVPWGFLLLFAVVILSGITVLVLVTWRRRRDERLADKTRIEQTRAAVRQQRDAVSNDILKLEDEVRAAGNEDALAHYRNATITYAAIVGESEAGDTPEELTKLAARLDTAIWQLDTAEAILDGNPLPPEPQPRALPQSQQPYRYQQRSGRSSSVGVVDLITAMLEAGPMLPGPWFGRRRHHSSRKHC
jgi:type II secretory pathway pseudopilin PulG